MFSTRNTRLVRVTCLRSELDRVLDLLVTSGCFQFKRVSLGLVDELVVDTVVVNRLRSLLAEVDLRVNGRSARVKRVVTEQLSVSELESLFAHAVSLKDLLVVRELVNSLIEVKLLYKFVGAAGGAVLIEGWVPVRSVKRLVKRLSGCVVEVAESFDAPVVLSNNSLFKPFELLTRFYSAPRYGDVDPTPVFAVSFLLFFGLMTSDLFDGLLLVLVGLFGFRRGSVFRLVLLLGLSSAFFGLLFGEALGGVIPLTPWWFSPFSEPLRMLYLVIGVGLVHLIIGHLIGLVNVARSDGLFRGVANHLSFVLMLVSVFFFASNHLVAYSLLITGLFLLFIGHSVSDIVELPSLVGNVISYSRLLAINMAHVGIAKAFALLGLSLNPLLGDFIIFFGQVILLTLGLIVAFVHSLRLHFVEFFTKFMRHGSWFKPYLSKRLYTITA